MSAKLSHIHRGSSVGVMDVMTVSQHLDDTDIYSINLIYLEKMDDFTKFDLIF